MNGKTYLPKDDQGGPPGVISVNAINVRGHRLAVQSAAVSNRPRELEALVDQLVTEVGAREAGYVFAAALGSLVQDILDPLIEVAESSGHDARGRLRDEAAKLAA